MNDFGPIMRVIDERVVSLQDTTTGLYAAASEISLLLTTPVGMWQIIAD